MSEALSLSLQAFPSIDKDKESLQYLIARINEQKGSFRNFDEQSLEKEIQEQEVGGVDSSEHDALDAVREAEDTESKTEEVAKARDEIRKQVQQAYGESVQALDFISLLLSRHSPASAQSTMSPYTKERLPLGCLVEEIVEAPRSSDVENKNVEMSAMGWRMHSLNGAADSLLGSATRLEKEMGQEVSYWGQILAVKEKGWSLSRLPREYHTLAVRYGFAEASPDFRDRGIAALRQNEVGNINLDRGPRWSGDKTLRVRILCQGKPVASSKGISRIQNHESLETQILKARNSIFDEELHHELHREARNLTNQGVHCFGTCIILPYEAGQQIELDLIPADDTVVEELAGDNLLADMIAMCLRLSLSYSHRQTLRNRSRPPPPLQGDKVSRQTYSLLRPLVEYIQHRSYVESTATFFETLRGILDSAGINTNLKNSASSHDLTDPLALSSIMNNPSSIEALFQTLTAPSHSTLSLSLPDLQIDLKVDIHTAIPPPTHGTTFHLTTTFNPPPDQQAVQIPPITQFTTLSAFQTHVIHTITLAVIPNLVTRSPTWRPVSPYTYTIWRNKSKSKDREVVSISMAKSQLALSWQRTGTVNEHANWIWYDGKLRTDGERRSLLDVFQNI